MEINRKLHNSNNKNNNDNDENSIGAIIKPVVIMKTAQ